MGSNKPGSRVVYYAAAAAALLLCPEVSYADQGGGSFWFPGQFASLAAVQQTPGWALAVIYYRSSVAAAGNVAAAREILTGRIPATVNVDLNLSLSGRADLVAPRAIVYFRDAGAWRSVGRRHVRPVRQNRRQYRRNTDGDSRTDCGDAHRNARRLAYLLRGPRTIRATAMEPRRQQLHGLRHRQYSRRRL